MEGQGSKLARVLLADSLLGANRPGSEKAWYPTDYMSTTSVTALVTAWHCLHLAVCSLAVITLSVDSIVSGATSSMSR